MTSVSPETLPVGYYAVGLLVSGEEIDIYRASASEILNVATGLPVASLLGWRRRLKPEGPQKAA
jgi:hypothetical protein